MSMGDKVGELYDGIGISVTQLNLQQPAYGSYIHAADGFVAINLTKSIVRTLMKKPVLPWDTMYEAPSLGKDDEGLPIVPTSRYHEVVVVTTDDWPSKTDVDAVHPDARSQWTVAPVFARYHWCLSEPPPVHITCSSANVISAWAIARSKSVCHALQMTACSTKSAVEIPTYPAYDCDIPERKDIADIDPAVNETRLCAEVTWPPSEDAKQEIFRRFREDGWEFSQDGGYPGNAPPDIWLDVSERECVSYPETCEARYGVYGIFGALFASLAALCVLVPCLMDWYMDMLLDSIITEHVEEEAELKAEELRRKQRREAQARAVVEGPEVPRPGLSDELPVGS